MMLEPSRSGRDGQGHDAHVAPVAHRIVTGRDMPTINQLPKREPARPPSQRPVRDQGGKGTRAIPRRAQ
jgi:hypothetical protein